MHKQKKRYSHGLSAILKDLWRNTKGSRYLLILIFVGMMGDGFLQSSMVAYLKVIIDQLTKSSADFIHRDWWKYVLYGLSLALLFFPFAYTGHFSGKLLASRLIRRYRLQFYEHLQKLSPHFYFQNKVGEISTRVVGDIESGFSNFTTFLMSYGWVLSILVCSLTTMIILSWKLSLIFVVIMALFTFVSRSFLPKIKGLSREIKDRSGGLTANVTEFISSFSLIKSFAVEESFLKRFREIQNHLYGTQVKAGYMTMLYLDITQVLFSFVAPVIILVCGAFFIDRGITLGTLIAFWAYWQVVRSPLNTLFNGVTLFYDSVASIDRVMEFFDQSPLVKDDPTAREFRFRDGKVEFKEVEFSYDASNSLKALHQLSFILPAKSSLGIVGPSGAGKSTVVQLLLRFYDPVAGHIYVDDTDIKKIKQQSLRRQIGVVFQDTILLSGAIRDNLLLGKEDATDDEIWNALEAAGAKEFVKELDSGLDAELGERGMNLSGGQRQRLSIARVFLKNPPIVIFDEATSALDTMTEIKIQEAMQKLLHGRTSIIIAHRLSTIVRCDQIMLMDHGRMIDLGTHQDLLRRCKLYAQLVEKQSLAA